jgi:hypothetical protein
VEKHPIPAGVSVKGMRIELKFWLSLVRTVNKGPVVLVLIIKLLLRSFPDPPLADAMWIA